MEEYLDSLNESQREAVLYMDGPQLVIAGAGSGKTRVLTMKVAHLLHLGYRPEQIIALTFTKKAATEMRTRIIDLVGFEAARGVWMGTFHALFSRILRSEAERIGFKPGFTIYDQSDSRSLVKSLIREMQLDDKKYKPNAIQGQISNAKNNLVTPAMYAANRELVQYDNYVGRPRFAELYKAYWTRCYQAGAMDFDDLLLYTNILFRDHPDVLAFYQDRFAYVLVDEYQDTNRAQHLIVEQLVRRHHHLCVVGDDAQSIYSFRGANISNILNLQQTVPGTRLFKLEQNYRSTRTIVNAANSLIHKNRGQIPKTIFSEKEAGTPITVTATYSDFEEAYAIASQVANLHTRGYQLADCAILYRTNAQSRVIEEALRKRGIAYHIYGGLSFYQRKEIKDILAYLRLLVNPADEEAFRRVINYPARGLGDTTLRKLATTATTAGVSFFEVCRDPAAHGLDVNRGTAAKLQGFAAFITSFVERDKTADAYDVTRALIFESGIRADLAADDSVEGMSRRENVEELLAAIQSFVTTAREEGRADCRIADFLTDVSLSGDVEPQAATDGDNADSVPLMTIHSAKGLEFRNVFIAGVEENLLPSEMSYDEPGGVEEERRLFYVAITRAQDNCFLSYAASRFRNGSSNHCRPSRFIHDIDTRYLRFAGSDSLFAPSQPASFATEKPFCAARPPQTPASARPIAPSSPHAASHTRRSTLDFAGCPMRVPRPAPAAAPTSISYGGHPLSAGLSITHDRFGHGIISSIDGDGDNARITVRFDNVGLKTLLLKFAKIRVD